MTEDHQDVTPAAPAPEAQERPPRPPQKPRPKMSLGEQSVFLLDILERCKMLDKDQRGLFAGEALLALTHDDMLRLETVQQTIAIFEMHGADRMVRDKISRSFRR